MTTLAARTAVVPVAASAPVTNTRKETLREKAAIERGLEEVRVNSVRVDGLALMKLIKHSREAHLVLPAPVGTSNATLSFSPAVGQLLGIDSNGVLEISNVFPLPAGSLGLGNGEGESETRGVKGATKYSQQILSRLDDLSAADNSVVGFYASTNNGQHLAMTGFVEALLGAQLGGGGIGAGNAKAVPVGRATGVKAALPAGSGGKSGKGIALVFDVASASQGHVGLRAFRLTTEFIEAYRGGKFDTQSLIEHKLVPSNMLEELPVSIHSSSMLTAFLSTLVTPSPITGSRQTPITPAASFATLSLPTSTSSFSSSVNPAPLSAPIAALISAMDTHQAHLSTLSFQSRQLTRDRAKLESNPQNLRRRLENEQRAKDGIPLLPLSAEEAALVEPSRLETMLALGAVEGATRALSEASGAAVVRSFGAKGGVENA